jgi:Tfp pilus assembly protein PilF
VVGELDDAFSKFKKALKINPKNVGAYVARGQIYREEGRISKRSMISRKLSVIS